METAAAALHSGDGGGRPNLDRPPKADLGDYSTNAAMLLAPVVGRPPREVAEELRAELETRLEGAERVEVAGPGFLNLFLTDAWHRKVVASILAAGDAYGAGPDRATTVMVEFVSANPTGPLHVGHGRGAAFGDAVSTDARFRGLRRGARVLPQRRRHARYGSSRRPSRRAWPARSRPRKAMRAST